MIKTFIVLTGLFAGATGVNASVSADTDPGMLVSGTETTKPYVKELEIRVKGDAKYTEMLPATYTLRNGIYLMPNGSCVDRKTELEKMERLEKEDGYIETPVLQETVAIVGCPE